MRQLHFWTRTHSHRKQGLSCVFAQPCSQPESLQKAAVTQRPSVAERTHTGCAVCVADCHSAVGRKDFLTHAGTRENPEGAMLSDVGPSQKDRSLCDFTHSRRLQTQRGRLGEQGGGGVSVSWGQVSVCTLGNGHTGRCPGTCM